jgi:NAD(P)-dependent dehydrogenase (short-subunit alcohol dehydrogenase family)
VASPEGGAAIVRKATDTFGRLDAVVSNAGILNLADFDQLTVDQWRGMMSVHLDGSFYLSQPAYRVMKAQGYGRFVFIASGAGAFGINQHAHYGAAKMGIVGLKNVIAVEGKPHGILANSVLPWGMTRMFMVGTGANDSILDNPLIRALDPQLAVPMVVYLASRACNVSHQDYTAGAGRFARVFTGLGGGWFAGKGKVPTADDVDAQFAKVSATDPYYVPFSCHDETKEICEMLGISL